MSNLYTIYNKDQENQVDSIKNRLLALELHYGLSLVLSTYQDLKHSQYDTDGYLPTHLKNLVRTYGVGLVSGIVKARYSRELRKVS